MPVNEDRTLYCVRCGISFVWTYEEQQTNAAAQGAAFAPAAYCPGCGHLMPAQGRERGIVRWFNKRRGYGFIVRGQDPEVFVHVSEVRGGQQLFPGALVEFAVGETERGLSAQAIEVLADSTSETPDQAAAG